ncbi:MAG: hypothetical protein Q4G42_03010 [Neisseria sp.]|nr:hypothetical protein [Neisseria sp.]
MSIEGCLKNVRRVQAACIAYKSCLLCASLPHGQLTFFASSKKVSKERRPHGAGFGFAKTSRSKSRLCGGLELLSAAPPLKHASPFLRKNGFLNGCFKGIGRMK